MLEFFMAFDPKHMSVNGKVSLLRSACICRRAEASQPFCPTLCKWLQFHHRHFEPETLSHKVCCRLLLESRLQHRIPSDVEGEDEVSVHELLAFIASCGAQLCRDS